MRFLAVLGWFPDLPVAHLSLVPTEPAEVPPPTQSPGLGFGGRGEVSHSDWYEIVIPRAAWDETCKSLLMNTLGLG